MNSLDIANSARAPRRSASIRPLSRAALAAACVATLLSQAGCAGLLPPSTELVALPPEPAKQMPQLPDEQSPPDAGTGRVYFDVTNGSARIYEVLEESSATAVGSVITTYGGMGTSYATESGQRTRFVCVTPCAADFPLGGHQIQIVRDGRAENVYVRAGTKPLAHRHTMGYFRPADGGKHNLTVGLWAVGIPAMLIGGMITAAVEDKRIGLAVIGGGAVLATSSHLIGLTNTNASQNGTFVQWQLPPIKFLWPPPPAAGVTPRPPPPPPGAGHLGAACTALQRFRATPLAAAEDSAGAPPTGRPRSAAAVPSPMLSCT